MDCVILKILQISFSLLVKLAISKTFDVNSNNVVNKCSMLFREIAFNCVVKFVIL